MNPHYHLIPCFWFDFCYWKNKPYIDLKYACWNVDQRSLIIGKGARQGCDGGCAKCLAPARNYGPARAPATGPVEDWQWFLTRNVMMGACETAELYWSSPVLRCRHSSSKSHPILDMLYVGSCCWTLVGFPWWWKNLAGQNWQESGEGFFRSWLGTFQSLTAAYCPLWYLFWNMSMRCEIWHVSNERIYVTYLDNNRLASLSASFLN
jgi:hypothetical protein